MATRINRVAGRHGGFLSDSAGLQPHQLDLVYASTTAFLAAKSASGNNSASAEEGDWFYDSTDNTVKYYDGSSWTLGLPGTVGSAGRVLTVNAAGTTPVWSNGKIVSENFNGYTTPGGATDVQLTMHENDYTAVSGTTAALNILHGVNASLQFVILGAGQTLFPTVVAAGLDVGCDQTDNEGIELTSHWGDASGKRPFVVGEDPAFYFKCKFEIAVINGCDVLAVGFRRAPFSPGTSQEDLVNADLNDYLDMAALGLTTAATPGAIKIQTIDDNAATTVTDTTNTIASATALTVKVLVSAAGVVTYQHDAVTPGTLAAPTTTAAFTLDTGDPVVPFFHYLHANAAQAGAITIHSWEAGYQ